MTLPRPNRAPPISTNETTRRVAIIHGWATGTMRVGPSCAAASGASPSERRRAGRPAYGGATTVLAAVLLYRLIGYWAVLPAGAICYLSLWRRHFLVTPASGAV